MDETHQADLGMIDGFEFEHVTIGELEKLIQDAESGDNKAIRQLEVLAERHKDLFLGIRDTLKDLNELIGSTPEERTANLKKFREYLEREEQKDLSLVEYKTEDTLNAVFTVGKVTNHLARIDQSGGKGGLQYGKKKDFVIDVSISLQDKDVEVPKLTTFDTRVLNAVCSFHHEGLTAFTATQVYKRMNGITSLDYKVDEITLKAIRDSIQKMRIKMVKIDVTKLVEGKWKFKQPVKKAIIEDYVLPLKYAEIKHIDGTVMEGWALHAEPIIYTHSRRMGDIETYSPQLLNYPGNQTQQKGDIFQTLLTNIVSNIKRVKNSNNKRTYKNILEAAGLDVENMSKQTLSNNIKIVNQMLDHMVEQKHIKGWEVDKAMRDRETGKTVRGVVIHV